MNPLSTHPTHSHLVMISMALALVLRPASVRADEAEDAIDEEDEVEQEEDGEEQAEQEIDEDQAQEDQQDAQEPDSDPGKKSQAKVLLPVSEKGATVLLDDEEVGVTPLPALTGLAVGTHTLRVDKEGFYTYTAQIDVPEEGQLRHDVLMDGGASSQTELPAFMKTWWFWTAVGAVVLTGATVGIYFGVKEDPPDAVKFPPY